MQYRFHNLDVFTDRVFGGNPLAVLPDARGLTGTQMQCIAGEFNLSETVFVLPAEAGGTRRIRIFTPTSEHPFAGHPTIGTAFLLAALGAVPLADGITTIVLEEGVGPVPVAIRARGGKAEFAQLTAAKLPESGPPPPPRADIAALLTLEPHDVSDGRFRAEALSCGVPFLFVPLRDRAAVARARIDLGHWRSQFASLWAPHVYVFALDPELPGSDVRARMFAPALGIPEDPATGGAVTALAGYLAARDARMSGTLRWTVEQGFEMGRPSLLYAEATKLGGDITAVRVGGSAVLVGEGTIEVPPDASTGTPGPQRAKDPTGAGS